jgi:hypothetical protein
MSPSKKQLHAILSLHQSQFTRCTRPTLRKVFFAIENAFSRRQRVQLKIKILSARTDNRCPF